MFSKEVWKELDNIIGYEISSNGKIRNKNKKELKTFFDKDGYVCIKIHDRHYKLHRLVAKAFLNDYSEKLEVNHINGIKSDNNINNIEMCSHKQNINHSYYVLNNKIKKIKQYDLQGNFIREWKNSKEIYDTYGYKRYNISRACNKKRKTAYGYIWEYINEI